MKTLFPETILSQHTAVLGKTGSGKTSTGKLIVEQVVRSGARVCVLDPIKSDWWGLTSSANGKQAGLPFHILGGPHGHVPVHAQAGKAIAEIVGNGSLPLSIIDMADFGPGGQAAFFTDFAPVLLRKMRGVLYLVIEEAHLFAPKERSGIGNENMAIHWAKTLATAGRSKGIRLVVLTQRTQALHNAVLGSCDTMIVHRLTAPADQKPVKEWLNANVADKSIREKVEGSLSSLKTGTGWLCSGEAMLFEQITFPRITTYDNTATPTGYSGEHNVRTAPVDQEKLRALIGEVVEKAKADDPKELRRKIIALEKQLAERPAAEVERVEVPVIGTSELARLEQVYQGASESLKNAGELLVQFRDAMLQAAPRPMNENGRSVHKTGSNVHKTASFGQKTCQTSIKDANCSRDNGLRSRTIPRTKTPDVASDSTLTPRQQRFLDAAASLATLGAEVTRDTVAGWVGVHPRGGSVGEELKALVDGGFILMDRGRITVTDAGADAAGQVDPSEAIDRAKSGLSARQAKFFEAICGVYPDEISREQIAEQFGLHPRGGSLGEDLGRLVGRGLVEGSRGRYRCRDFLFAGSMQ